jgi:hypothetical protein
VDAIVGEIRLVQTPWVSHSWRRLLRHRARPIDFTDPARRHVFQADFDFIDHQLVIQTEEASVEPAARPRTVADFYRALMALLAGWT